MKTAVVALVIMGLLFFLPMIMAGAMMLLTYGAIFFGLIFIKRVIQEDNRQEYQDNHDDDHQRSHGSFNRPPMH